MTCRNCGAELTGEFCAACGQRVNERDPTLREFLRDFAEHFLQWDGRIATSFRLLVTQPGELTTEYVAGRRIRYLSPLRLYLTCSVLFFFVSALLPNPQLVLMRSGAEPTQVGPTNVGDADSTEMIAALDTMAKHGRWVGRVWGAHFGQAMRHRGEVASAVAANIPRTMFVLVPLFAALVGLVYRSGRRRYPQHLAFALHVHALLFLALTATLARRLTTSDAVQVLIGLPIMVLIAIYFVRALRRVYGGSRRSAIVRAGAVSFTYFVSFLVAMVLTVGLIVLVQF